MLLLEQYQNSKNACDREVRFQKAWEATLSEHSNGAVCKLPEHVRDTKLIVK